MYTTRGLGDGTGWDGMGRRKIGSRTFLNLKKYDDDNDDDDKKRSKKKECTYVRIISETTFSLFPYAINPHFNVT